MATNAFDDRFRSERRLQTSERVIAHLKAAVCALERDNEVLRCEVEAAKASRDIALRLAVNPWRGATKGEP